MHAVNIHEAKTHPSRLVEQDAHGEPFIIAKAGRPLVKMVPLEPASEKRGKLGFLRGQVQVSDDFDTLGQDAIAEQFLGDAAR